MPAVDFRLAGYPEHGRRKYARAERDEGLRNAIEEIEEGAERASGRRDQALRGMQFESPSDERFDGEPGADEQRIGVEQIRSEPARH